MLLYLKRLRASGASPTDAALRGRCGVLSGALGIALNIILFAAKLTAALLSGSVAVIADAFNNLGDAGSSVVAMIGFKLSGKKPDLEHPFGHGRVEYITGFVVSIAIILMGFELALSSFKSIGSQEAPEQGMATILILIGSVLVKLYMALYNYKLSKFFGSAAMKATAVDSLSDMISTSAVLAALVISRAAGISLDSYMGLLVSAFILYSGMMSAKDTIAPLLGVPPEQSFVDEIESIVTAEPAVAGMHDLVVHDYGPGRCMISLHAEMPSNIDVFKAHSIIDDLENKLQDSLGCEAVIHFDPIDTDDERLRELKNTVSQTVKELDNSLSIHDFRYVPGDTHTNLIFDVVVPFNLKCRDEELKRKIGEEVSKKLPNHNCVIKCDRSMVL